MAKVVYGGGVASFKGSIGTLTFQNNRSGAIVRRRQKGRKTITEKQSTSISLFQKYKSLWQDLSQANINLWNTFADTYTKTDAWGTIKTLSGYNWFCSINYYRVLTGNSVLSSPPLYESPLTIPAFSLIVKKDRIVLRFETSWGSRNDNLIIYTTYPIQNKTNSFRMALRRTKIVQLGTFHSYDLTGAWEYWHNLTYPPGQTDPRFYIGIAIRTSKKAACIMSPSSFAITKFDNVDGGIGSMLIGSTFIVG